MFLRRSLGLAVAVLVLLYLGLVAVRAYLRPAIPEDEVRPPGRWTAVPPARVRAAGDDRLARVLSLPYVAGKVEAGRGPYGVVAWERDRAWNGVNLVVSAHAPEVALMDMAGLTLHRWRCPYSTAFPGRTGTQGTEYFRRARLLPSGELLAIYQGGGLVALNPDGSIRWTFDAGFYNDLRVGPEGGIYGLTKRARIIPEIDPREPVLEDSLLILSPEGELVQRVSLLAAMRRSPFAGLLSEMAHAGDVLHSNTVAPFDGSLAGRSHLFARGNVLFSLRQVSVIGIVDPGSGEVLWAARGPWRHQHEPTPLPSGHLLLFDNLGPGGRHSRVLEVAVPSGEVVARYDGPEADPLWSEQGGVVQPLPNGNRVVVESERGRALEVTPQAEVVWEFLSPYRAGQHDQLVATLFEVERLPEEAREWVEGTARSQ